MPIAAVPKYLGRNFKNASPALRFSMLLPLWRVSRGRLLYHKRRKGKDNETLV